MDYEIVINRGIMPEHLDKVRMISKLVHIPLDVWKYIDEWDINKINPRQGVRIIQKSHLKEEYDPIYYYNDVGYLFNINTIDNHIMNFASSMGNDESDIVYWCLDNYDKGIE